MSKRHHNHHHTRHHEPSTTSSSTGGMSSPEMSSHMMSDDPGLRGDTTPNMSGAPEAGGATTRGSLFGGRGFGAMILRAVARAARAVEAAAYRRLRDMDQDAGDIGATRGRPNRVRNTRDFEQPSPA